jgi:hypothetical protein
MCSARQIWFDRALLLFAVALLFVWPLIALGVFLAWTVYVFSVGTYYQGYQGPSLERALGFELGCEFLRDGWQSALAINAVVAEGVLADAGSRGDEVLPDWSRTEFFRYLHRNRGHVVELEVVEGDCGGTPFETRARRTLRFGVPTAVAAPPTRDDFRAVILVWSPLILIAVGGALGYLVSQATLPAGPFWAQFLIVYFSASVGCFLGVMACPPTHQGTRA